MSANNVYGGYPSDMPTVALVDAKNAFAMVLQYHQRSIKHFLRPGRGVRKTPARPHIEITIDSSMTSRQVGDVQVRASAQKLEIACSLTLFSEPLDEGPDKTMYFERRMVMQVRMTKFPGSEFTIEQEVIEKMM